MKKYRIWIISGLLVLVLAALFGWRFYQRYAASEGKSGKAEKAAVTVDVVKVQLRDVKDVRMFTGNLVPWATYLISSKVGGNLVRHGNINIGDELAPESFIGKIDDTEYLQSLEQAQANYEVTAAQLNEAQLLLELRKREFDRQKELLKINSKSQYETAEYAVKTQEAAVKVKAAELKRQEAIVKIAQIKLDDTEIKCLMTKNSRCFVAEKLIGIGDLVAPNQTLLKAVDISRVKAIINVIEKDYGALTIGQKVKISTDAFPGKTFDGKILHIAKALQAKSRQAEVEIMLENRDLELKPGMFVRAFLTFGERKKAQLIPRSSVVKHNDEIGVFLFDEIKSVAEYVQITTGIVEGNQVEVIKPELKKRVITLGNHLLVNQTPVKLPESDERKSGDF